MRGLEQEREQLREEPGSRGGGSGSKRQSIPVLERSYSLSEQEMRTLTTVGTFRSVNVEDMPKARLDNLIRSGWIERKTVYPHKNGAKLDVLVVTLAGKRLLADQQPLDNRQRFHAGLVKHKELAHDAAIYPAYQQAAAAIERAGGTVERVVLDYELKSVINKEMNRGGSVSGEAKDERRRHLAEDLDLKVVDGKLPLPDLRIEYTDEHGERNHEDIEIVSRHYHGSHLVGKTAAGFRLHHSDGPRVAVYDHHKSRLI